ncbi:MAG: hypothetical protein DKINENOH_05421 [bacterium]|nr:hypothetical protein [bacterium]MCK6562422.1 T9SS type A sorting domain-containing protein [bacterium]NUM66041.1 T9SS type A sorting domain-containing protein [candidate division KSB1 bacterium]
MHSFSAFFLAACLPFVLFAQPSFITSLYPPQHGLNIPVDAELRVGLQTPLDPTSLSDSSIYVWSDITGLHRLTVTLENGNRDLRIVPRHWRLNNRPAFNAGERVTVTLTTRLRYADGRSFEGFTWHYTVAVRQNHGGDFKVEALFGGVLSTSFIVSDFNNDGWPDLIGNADIDYKMLVYFNDGKGIIRFNHKNDPIGIGPGNETADLDRDGDQDIPYTGNSSVLNDGTGNFFEKNFPFRLNGFAKAQDFNNDGIMDFVIGSVISDTLYFGLSQNGISFNMLLKSKPPIPQPTFYHPGISYDLDNDGKTDFVYVGGSIVDKTRVGFASFRSTESDSLKILQVQELPHEQTHFYGNDLDQDADIDYAFVPGAAGRYLTLFNDGSGQLNPSGLQVDTLLARYAETVEGGDFDGDGDIDLAFANSNLTSVMPVRYAPDVCIFMNDGCGIFSFHSQVPLPFDRPLSRGLRAVDLDRDGDLDLIGIANGLFYVVANGSYATRVDAPKSASTPIQFEFLPIYPNPAKSRANIELQFPNGSKHEVRIDVFDVTGRLVRNWVFANTETAISLAWNTQDQNSALLPDGVYFIQVQVGLLRAVQKLLVLR